MKRIPLPLCITLVIMGGLLLSTVVAQPGAYNISAWVVAGGGGSSTGGAYSVNGTIGQSASGRISGGTYSLESGYWAMDDSLIAAPPPFLYLPILNRSLPPTPTNTPTPTRTPTATPTSTVGPPQSCGDIEPNSEPNNASPLRVIGASCTGALGKNDREDWYVVSMNAGQTFSIDLTQMGVGEDYDLFLNGPNKLPAYICTGVAGGECKSSRIGRADERLTGSVAQSGLYYILIYGYERLGSDHTYLLAVTVR